VPSIPEERLLYGNDQGYVRLSQLISAFKCVDRIFRNHL
jgi:hypothetical protein